MNTHISDIQNIIDIITPVRLSSYKFDNTITDKDLLNNYLYNIKVAEAFYPALSLLEITLRNKICSAIHQHIKQDWLISELSAPKILGTKEYKKLVKASEKLTSRGKTITNDRLIAELTLGFWIHLCTKAYKPKLWDKRGFFELVFPNYKTSSGLRSIAPIQNDLYKILRLRNRIFHHEIIINGKISVENHHQIIRDLLYLMSVDMVNLLDNTSNFNTITKQKP